MEKSSNNCHSGMRCSFLIKERDSNIELLRIVSMFLVMIVHADYLALGTPTQEDISASYCNSFARAFVEALSCICVNVFVLISGWFKIKFRFERLMEFIFQVIFIGVALYFLMRVLGYRGYEYKGLDKAVPYEVARLLVCKGLSDTLCLCTAS